MSKKLFVVSDVHGYFTALSDALASAGFDSANEEHIFVSCGDLFDRGTENRRIYDFVRSLERKILIRGNHEEMLREILINGKLEVHNIHNGTDITVKELFGAKSIDNMGNVDLSDRERIDEIVEFIDSMTDYYEAGEYIFTHGWVPIVLDKYFYPTVDPDWRNADEASWHDARWTGWWQPYGKGAVIEGKTIVCGHRPARMGRNFDESRDPYCDDPFFGNGLIAIDTYTVKSGKVSVLQLTV